MAKSVLNKIFFSALLIIPAMAVTGSESLESKPLSGDCSDIVVEIRITKPDRLIQKSTAEAIVTGAEKPVFYIFYKASGDLLSKDVTSSKAKNIDAGTYYCSIVDGKGCTKKTEFKIEQ